MRTAQRLDAVCELTMGQAPIGESYNNNRDGLPLIAGAGDFGEVHPAAKKFTTAPGKVCASGDIVLGIRATIGEKVVADREYCLGRGVAGLRARADLDSRYLWHWLTHVAPVLAAKAKGATFKQVNREDIGELTIALPPLPEQRRIADVLDRAETLRAKRRAALAQLDTLTQSIFLDMFGDPVTNPKGWPRVGLREAYWFQEGPGVRKWQFQDEGVKLLNVGNIEKNGSLNLDKTKRYLAAEEAFGKYRHFLVDAGDLVIASSGISFDHDGLLRTRGAIVAEEQLPLCMNTSTIRFKPIDGVSDLRFLWVWLNSREFRSQITKCVTGSAQQNFGPSHLSSLMITLPPLPAQHEFARRVCAIDALRTIHRASLTELDYLFYALQHHAFRG